MWEPGTAIAGSCRGRAGCRPVCSGNRSRCGGSCRMPGNANTRFCTPNNRQNAPDEPPQWEENALARHLNFQQIPQTSETHRPQARTQKGLNQPQKRGLPPKSRALKKPPTAPHVCGQHRQVQDVRSLPASMESRTARTPPKGRPRSAAVRPSQSPDMGDPERIHKFVCFIRNPRIPNRGRLLIVSN